MTQSSDCTKRKKELTNTMKLTEILEYDEDFDVNEFQIVSDGSWETEENFLHSNPLDMCVLRAMSQVERDGLSYFFTEVMDRTILFDPLCQYILSDNNFITRK
ncbi:uncharacterized protein [Prorops nasuta]